MFKKVLCVATIILSLVFYFHESAALDDPEDIYLKGRDAFLNFDYEGAYELYSKYIELCLPIVRKNIIPGATPRLSCRSTMKHSMILLKQ